MFLSAILPVEIDELKTNRDKLWRDKCSTVGWCPLPKRCRIHFSFQLVGRERERETTIDYLQNGLMGKSSTSWLMTIEQRCMDVETTSKPLQRRSHVAQPAKSLKTHTGGVYFWQDGIVFWVPIKQKYNADAFISDWKDQ